jgi:hypothetical protein
MAKREKTSKADHYDPKRQTRVEDIVTAARTVADSGSESADFSRGYHETFDPNMHINQGRPARKSRE